MNEDWQWYFLSVGLSLRKFQGKQQVYSKRKHKRKALVMSDWSDLEEEEEEEEENAARLRTVLLPNWRER